MDLNAWTQAQRAVIGSLLIDPENVAGIVFATAKRDCISFAAVNSLRREESSTCFSIFSNS